MYPSPGHGGGSYTGKAGGARSTLTPTPTCALLATGASNKEDITIKITIKRFII
jgi:hypothetical protein